MRNLKRALSLGLASVMVMGMMAVGASAVSYDDLTDKDEIVNKEAVQMLVELNVINGKDDGSYDPTGIVTRAEMAKMICVVLNGGKDPNLGTAVTNSYTDTVGHWAAGYIEYCTQLGIVAGDGTGKFNPSATVTGSEAAKMLLVAMGYKSEIEGFTGANWALAVNTRASQKGLYNDLNINANEGLTRDNAAQMIYNALDADVVSYDYTLVTDGSSISSSPTLKDDGGKSLLEDKFNAVKVEGVVVANEVANLNTTGATDEGKTIIAVTNEEDQSSYSGNETFSISTGMEDLGRSVVLYVKKNSNASKAEIFGSVIASGDNLVVVDYTGDSVADVASDNNLDIITSGSDATQYVTNYGSADDITTTQRDQKSTAGVEKYLIDNDDDGEVEYVIVNTYTFGKVTSYVTSGDGSITVRGGTANTFSKSDADDVVGFDDVAKDDYVNAIEIGGKLYVEKAETVTGEMEAYKQNSSDVVTKLTVDGTDYNVSAVPGYTGGEDDIKDPSAEETINLDTEATFYLGKGGYIVAVGDVAENAYNYALVLATGTTGLEDRVRVALSDGSTGTYDYTSNSDDPEVGKVYSYSINSDNEIRLTAIASGNTKSGYNTNLTFEKGKTSIKADSKTTLYANGNTAFFYVTDDDLSSGTIDTDDVDVYTGYNKAPDLKTGVKAVIYTRGDSNSTRAAAVVFYGSDLTTGAVEDTLYITDKGTSTSDYTNATAFIPGSAEAQDIKVEGSVTAGKAYTYTVNSDGYYELNASKLDGSNTITSGTVSSANSNTFVVGSKEFVITSDTLFVDDSKYLDDPVAELGAGPDAEDTIKYVVFNGDEEAILVVIANPEEGGSTSGDLNTSATVVNSDSRNDYANPTFYVEDGHALSNREMRNALIAQMQKDGCTDISVDGNTFNYTQDGIQVSTEVKMTQVYKVATPTLKTTEAVNGLTLTAVKADVEYIAAGKSVTITVTTNKAAIENTKTNTITATGTYGESSTVASSVDTAAGDGSTPAQETYEITLTMPSADLTKIEVTMVDKA